MFKPISNDELKSAVDACLKLSAVGDCAEGPHGPIGDWDVSSVTDMHGLFFGATSFNADISKWHVSNVTNMFRVFDGAKSFNGDILKWDVSSVTNMESMFNKATSFNSDISTWDVSRVTNMAWMFWGATSFNNNISPWDASSVASMQDMFNGATSFAQTLCGTGWTKLKANQQDMFTNSKGKIDSETPACLGLYGRVCYIAIEFAVV